jgi:hypothetical protein
VALLVVMIGTAVPLVAYPGVLHSLHLGPSRPSITLPTWAEWKTGSAPHAAFSYPASAVQMPSAQGHTLQQHAYLVWKQRKLLTIHALHNEFLRLLQNCSVQASSARACRSCR